jgi:hypothetical protein
MTPFVENIITGTIATVAGGIILENRKRICSAIVSLFKKKSIGTHVFYNIVRVGTLFAREFKKGLIEQLIYGSIGLDALTSFTPASRKELQRRVDLISIAKRLNLL